MRLETRTLNGRTVVLLRPVKIAAYWGFGALFVVVGVLVAIAAGRQTTLTCEAGGAGEASCRLESRGVLSESRATGRLTGARTEDRVAWGFIATREVVLALDDRDVVAGFVGANGDDKNAIVAALDDLTEGRRTAPVVYGEDLRLLWGGFGLVIVAGGVVILLSIEFIRIVLDPARGLFTLRSRAWWRRRREALPLDQISEIEVRPFTVRRQTSFNVVLRLADDRDVPVARMPLFTEDSAARTAALIEAARPRPTASA